MLLLSLFRRDVSGCISNFVLLNMPLQVFLYSSCTCTYKLATKPKNKYNERAYLREYEEVLKAHDVYIGYMFSFIEKKYVIHRIYSIVTEVSIYFRT